MEKEKHIVWKSLKIKNIMENLAEKSKNRKFTIISVDTNDGDTVSKTIEITEEQALVLGRVADAIKEFKSYIVMGWNHDHNFPTDECLRTDLGELSPEDYYVKTNKISPEDFKVFLGLVPYCEHGFHTVYEIRILAVIGDIKLL